MGKRRSISNEIRLSQSFARLTLRQRDMWHGLIATADDQGRLPGLPAAIRSLVWPYDDILLSDVQKELDTLADSGNIIIYNISNDAYVQIINWWNYQKPQWAAASKYPPPDGWLDRERFHGKGRKIFTKNWDTPGGYFIATEEVKVKDNVKVNPLSKTYNTKVDNKGSQFPFLDVDTSDLSDEDKRYRQFLNLFFTSAKLPLDSNLRPRDNDAVLQWISNECTPEDIAAAVQYSTDNELTIVGPASIHKGVMIARGNRLRQPKVMTTVERMKAAGYGDARE